MKKLNAILLLIHFGLAGCRHETSSSESQLIATPTPESSSNKLNLTTAADTTPPSTPAAPFSVTALNGTQLKLDWGASSDGGAILGYNVYQVSPVPPGGTHIASTATNTHTTANNLVPNTTYCFVIQAYDTSHNLSGTSSEFCGTTAALRITSPANGFSVNGSLSIQGNCLSGQSLSLNIISEDQCSASTSLPAIIPNAQMTQVLKLPNGNIFVQFKGLANTNYLIQAKTTLFSPWQNLNFIKSDGLGNFSFEDLDTSLYMSRFYQAAGVNPQAINLSCSSGSFTASIDSNSFPNGTIRIQAIQPSLTAQQVCGSNGVPIAIPPAPPMITGYQKFVNDVLPILKNNCGSCHTGERFAYASLINDD